MKLQYVPITHFHLKSPSASSHSLIFSSGQTWINDEHQFGGQLGSSNFGTLLVYVCENSLGFEVQYLHIKGLYSQKLQWRAIPTALLAVYEVN